MVNSADPAHDPIRNTSSEPQVAPTTLVIVIVSNMSRLPVAFASRGIYPLPPGGFKV
jgi:hypothetical protein